MIEDDVCPECSALVDDLVKHSRWHRALRRSAREGQVVLPPPLVGSDGEIKT